MLGAESRWTSASSAHHALAHLAGGLIGEGYRQNGGRRHMLRRDDIGDAMRDDPGFAAAGARENQKRSFCVS